MIFKEKWIKNSYDQFKLVHPEWNKKDILQFLDKVFDRDFKDVPCTLYNNYEKVETKTTLDKIIDWNEKVKPIISYSGTFFKRHSLQENPRAIVLQSKLDSRDEAKKLKYKYGNLASKETNPVKKQEYKDLEGKYNLKQKRLKVIANSDYGVSGLPSSFEFNIACASAVTLTAHAYISTAYTTFENFLADSVYFKSMDECLMYILNIVRDENTWELKLNKYIDKEVTPEEVYDRLLIKFSNKDMCNKHILMRILKKLPNHILQRLYYKNNLYTFIRNSSRTKEIINNIVLNIDKFYNSDLSPKELSPYVISQIKKLTKILMEFIHYNHMIPDKQIRLQTEQRKVVKLIDTDSNFIYLKPWYEFIKKEVIDKKICVLNRPKVNGRILIDAKNPNLTKKFLYKENEMYKIANIMVYILGEVINKSLRDIFLTPSNIEQDCPGKAYMKSEIICWKMLITEGKKHYAALYKLQEGNYYHDAKTTVASMEWDKKSNTTEYAHEFNKNLIFNTILGNDKLEPSKILHDLSEFENSIENMIVNGDFNLLNLKRVKLPEAYKDPMGNGPYKAVFIWNFINPDNQIELPGRAYMLKVNMSKLKDISQLSVTYPNIFEKLNKLFTTNDRIKKSGINQIALPLSLNKLPEWLKPYMATEEIILSNTNLSLPILKALNISTIYKSKNDKFFSNIINI